MNTGLLLIRLLIGLVVFADGSRKLFGVFGGEGMEVTRARLESMGFRPGPRQAWVDGGTELAGGALLVIGLFTPLAAALILSAMAFAAIAGHSGTGSFVQGDWEYRLLLGGSAAGMAFTGPGAFSFDHLAGMSGGGSLWGLFAIALGIAGAAGRLATRDTSGVLLQPSTAVIPTPDDPTRIAPSD